MPPDSRSAPRADSPLARNAEPTVTAPAAATPFLKNERRFARFSIVFSTFVILLPPFQEITSFARPYRRLDKTEIWSMTVALAAPAVVRVQSNGCQGFAEEN